MMQVLQLPTRQHELDHADHADHTDHTDHADQEYICRERSLDHELRKDHLYETDHLYEGVDTYTVCTLFLC